MVGEAVVRQGKASFGTQRMGQFAIRRERGEARAGIGIGDSINSSSLLQSVV